MAAIGSPSERRQRGNGRGGPLQSNRTTSSRRREARALAAGNPDSFLHVSRPEIDLPEGTDEHADAVYAKGAKNLAELVSRGVLRADPEPHLYVYAQKMGDHRQIGVVALRVGRRVRRAT